MNREGANRKILCDIAHCAFKVVNRMLSRDQLLAESLRSRTTGSRQIYNEECITVEMAVTLKEEYSQYVEITLFTHPEESKIGTDWYWRIERGQDAIHAHVQAKRVHRTKFGQQDKHGHIVIDWDQLPRLLRATKNERDRIKGLEAWLVTYARVHEGPPCENNNLQQCKFHKHEKKCKKEQPSLWIANAARFYKSSMPNVPISEVVLYSVRLDCVLPCIDKSENSGPSKKGLVLESELQSFDECVAIIENDPKLRKKFRGALLIHT